MPPVRKAGGYKLRRRCVPTRVLEQVSKPSSFMNISNPLDSGLLPKLLKGQSSSMVDINEVDKSGVSVFDNLECNTGLLALKGLELDIMETNEVFDIVTYCQDAEKKPLHVKIDSNVESSDGWSNWTENDVIDQIMKLTEDIPTEKIDFSTVSAIEQSLLSDFLTAESDIKANYVPVEPCASFLPIEMSAMPAVVCQSDFTSMVPLESSPIKIEFLPLDQERSSCALRCISATMTSSSMQQMSSGGPDVLKRTTKMPRATGEDAKQVDTKQVQRKNSCVPSRLFVPSGCSDTKCEKNVTDSVSFSATQCFPKSEDKPFWDWEEKSPATPFRSPSPYCRRRSAAEICSPYFRRQSPSSSSSSSQYPKSDASCESAFGNSSFLASQKFSFFKRGSPFVMRQSPSLTRQLPVSRHELLKPISRSRRWFPCRRRHSPTSRKRRCCSGEQSLYSKGSSHDANGSVLSCCHASYSRKKPLYSRKCLESSCARRESPCARESICARQESPCARESSCARRESPRVRGSSYARRESPRARGSSCSRQESPCARESVCARRKSRARGSSYARRESPCARESVCARRKSRARGSSYARQESPCVRESSYTRQGSARASGSGATRESPCAKKSASGSGATRESPCAKKKCSCVMRGSAVRRNSSCARRESPLRRQSPCTRCSPCVRRESPTSSTTTTSVSDRSKYVWKKNISTLFLAYDKLFEDLSRN